MRGEYRQRALFSMLTKMAGGIDTPVFITLTPRFLCTL
ncbi:hypothetical protein T1E_2871 [Pseudomonas putida DOT-T1E]|uniref:Uncharacterized protein n=1 Tax=Pseudomonas putida (strain DOT-T1E) TaxID=1196325 RepID=I7B112_PSEPT|nr:hypothetical protein T1E_2871 [Pseudomonas putida DOT-T1E]